MGQIKIIGIFIAIILMLGLAFQSFRIKELKQDKKQLETKINAINKQNELNKQDLVKRNEEITNNQGKIRELQNKIKNQFSKDSCVNVPVDDNFLNFLRNN